MIRIPRFCCQLIIYIFFGSKNEESHFRLGARMYQKMEQVTQKVEQLHLGKMTMKELASWRGITYNTWGQKSAQHFKQLEQFCVFEKVYGGIIVKQIKYPCFTKQPRKDINAYYQVVKNTQNHLCTISGVADFLRQTDPSYKNLSERQVRYRMSAAAAACFGDIQTGEEGIYGSRRYVWVIKMSSRPNHYRYFDKDQYILFKRLIGQLYKQKADKIIELALLDQRYRYTEEMTKQQYFLQREQLGVEMFFQVITLVKERTGLQIVRATQHNFKDFGQIIVDN